MESEQQRVYTVKKTEVKKSAIGRKIKKALSKRRR